MSAPIPPHLPRTGPGSRFLELSWEMFGELCRALALRVAAEYQPDVVVGIARSGAIPGAVVASILRVDFHSILITRREGESIVRERPAVLSAAPPEVLGRKVLVVDQICSSGETFRLAFAAVRDRGAAEVRSAAVFSRPTGFTPGWSALQTPATIVNPWDRNVFEGGDLVVNPRYRGVEEE